MEGYIQSELNPGKSHDIHWHSQKNTEISRHYVPKQQKVQLMGILNCTPDSFFDGGNYATLEKQLERGKELENEGADWIDIGGESTRPFAKKVSLDEELSRVIPLISALSKEVSVPISIDTRNVQVARQAIESGARFLNDVSGFENKKMRRLAADAKIPLCLMHAQGTPETMQINPNYPKGIIPEMVEWFKYRIDELLKEGVCQSQIYIDPGFGFGKTVQDNCEILQNLSEFRELGFPLLIGLSRKSFQSKIIGKQTRDLLSTTIALNTMSILEGASIIRVHDVKEHRDVLNILACVQK